MSKGQEVSRLLTATKSGKLWVGGALELLECRVLRERLGDVFRAVHAELVVREAVSEGANAVSAAADSVGIRVWGSVLKDLQRGVGLQRLRHVGGTLRLQVIVTEAV